MDNADIARTESVHSISCGAFCIQHVEERLGLPIHTVSEIENSFNPSGGSDGVSLLAIKNYIEETDGLHTFAGEIPLSKFKTHFDSALAILHSRKLHVDGSESGHYLILEKSKDTYQFLDPLRPPCLPLTTKSGKVLEKMADVHNLTGSALVVSRAPIEFKFPTVSILCSIATIVAALFVCGIVRFRRKRRAPCPRCP